MTAVFSLSQMFVFLSWYVMFNIHACTSFHVGAAASLFFAWLVNAQVSTPYVIAESMHEL